MDEPTVVEVFADVGCPFTHVGLRRFVEHRARIGRDDVRLLVRSWPLELVNGEALDAEFIAEEVDDIRRQIAPSMFADFRAERFPGSSLPAMGLAASAYAVSIDAGEQVSLELRDLLFERGTDIADPRVLARVAQEVGLSLDDLDLDAVKADHAEGVARGVIGSPHFFTPTGGFFCPALEVSRDDRGHLRILADPEGFESFLGSCFAS